MLFFLIGGPEDGKEVEIHDLSLHQPFVVYWNAPIEIDELYRQYSSSMMDVTVHRANYFRVKSKLPVLIFEGLLNGQSC